MKALTETDAKLQAIVERDRDHDCPGLGKGKVCVRTTAFADLPSRFGDFRIVAFWNNRDEKEHVAILHGDVVGKKDVLCRIHSECLTGDVVGSLRCDCRDQLTTALERIADEECGIVLYMRQEGRGIGLINKIRAYSLQDRGLDTVEANEALGFRDDERDYSVAAHMLLSLGIESVRLMTNNPKKIGALVELGIPVTARVPHIIPPNRFNEFYLRTKADRSGHWIDFQGKRHLTEQSDDVLVEGMEKNEAV